nr:pescadillo homolog [Tanacetum cinerariifolium]
REQFEKQQGWTIKKMTPTHKDEYNIFTRICPVIFAQDTIEHVISLDMLTGKAKVDGQKVTWLTPHAFQQVMSQDVDYKIMLTFLVFYEVHRSNFRTFVLSFDCIPMTWNLLPRLKALAADLYALTRYVGAKDQTNGTNDEESERRPAQLQDQLPSNEPDC